MVKRYVILAGILLLSMPSELKPPKSRRTEPGKMDLQQPDRYPNTPFFHYTVGHVRGTPPVPFDVALHLLLVSRYRRNVDKRAPRRLRRASRGGYVLFNGDSTTRKTTMSSSTASSTCSLSSCVIPHVSNILHIPMFPG